MTKSDFKVSAYLAALPSVTDAVLKGQHRDSTAEMIAITVSSLAQKIADSSAENVGVRFDREDDEFFNR